MEAVIATDARAYLTAAAVNLVMSAREHGDVMRATLGADLAVPDGQPLVWALRALGHGACHARVRARPDGRVLRPCREPGDPDLPLRGAHADALALLERRLRERFPGLLIAGGVSPPFRELTAAEEARVIADIDASGAAVVWVGTGQPKQELWMLRMRGRLRPRCSSASVPRSTSTPDSSPRPPAGCSAAASSGPTASYASRAGCGGDTPATTPVSWWRSPASCCTGAAPGEPDRDRREAPPSRPARCTPAARPPLPLAWMSHPQSTADVAVVGLGRVGLPLALSFADRGLDVVGVDNDPGAHRRDRGRADAVRGERRAGAARPRARERSPVAIRTRRRRRQRPSRS